MIFILLFLLTVISAYPKLEFNDYKKPIGFASGLCALGGISYLVYTRYINRLNSKNRNDESADWIITHPFRYKTITTDKKITATLEYLAPEKYTSVGTITFDTQKPLIYQTNITGSDNHFRYLMKLYQIACTFHKDAHLMFIENCTPQEKDFLKKFSIIECGGEKKLLGMPTMRAFECNESKAVIESSIENNVIHKEITDEKEVSSTLKNFDLNNLQYNDNKNWMIIKNQNNELMAAYLKPIIDGCLHLYIHSSYQNKDKLKIILESIFNNDYNNDKYQEQIEYGTTALFLINHNIDVISCLPLNFTLKKSAYNTFLISIDKEKNILGIPIAYKTINTPLTLHNIAFSIEDKPNKKREAEEYEKACQLFAENKAVGSKVLMGTHCAIARDKKEIVGLITYEQLDDKKTIKIHQAAVKDGYKNQNLAKMLFLFLVNSNEAISTIQFSCYRGNNRVIMAYTIHGAQEYANSDDKTSHYWSLDTKNFIRENKHLSFPNKTK